jgi:hypothetical protein
LGRKQPIFGFGQTDPSDEPIDIEAELAFYYDEFGKILSAKIVEAFANGQPIYAWPNVDLLNPSDSEERISEWISVVTASSPTARGDVLALFDLPSPSISKTVNTVKSGIANILNREPNFGVYSEGFSFADSNDVQVHGLARNKMFFQLLRDMHADFVFSDVEITIVESNWVHSLWKNGKLKLATEEPSDSVMVCAAELQLRPKSWFGFFDDTHWFDIELEVHFFLDPLGEVVVARLDKFSVDGWQVSDWPQVIIGDDTRKNLGAIADWFQALRREIESIDSSDYELSVSDKSIAKERFEEWT